MQHFQFLGFLSVRSGQECHCYDQGPIFKTVGGANLVSFVLSELQHLVERSSYPGGESKNNILVCIHCHILITSLHAQEDDDCAVFGNGGPVIS